MDLKTYQTAALTTAEPRAFSLDYLVPMIAGEIGEMIGHVAKAYWHGKSEEKLNEELKLELGDVAWGTAILLHVLAQQGSIPTRASYPPGYYKNRKRAFSGLMYHGQDLFSWYESESGELGREFIAQSAGTIWRLLESHSHTLTGHSFDDVLKANLAKLQSRAERGVLQGSGDHR